MSSIRKSLMLGAAMSAMTLASPKASKVNEFVGPPEPIQRDWIEDAGKKNCETKKCGMCHNPFAGMKKRKYCFACQPTVDRHRSTIHAARVERSPWLSNNTYTTRK